MLKGAIPRASRFQPCRSGGKRDWEGTVEVARIFIWRVLKSVTAAQLSQDFSAVIVKIGRVQKFEFV